jgi:TolB-like protein
MKLILTSILIVLSFSLGGAQSGSKINVAVSALEGRGLAEGEAGTLTDALSSYLSNTGSFRVMERGRMDVILKEQGFQQSGACTDAACIVEMGQLLGVDHMITGSIGKVGLTYSVNLRMINVGSGEIIRSLSKFYKGEIDGVLTDVLPAVAEELAGKQAAAAPAATKTNPPPAVVIPPHLSSASDAPVVKESVKEPPQPEIKKKKRRKWPWVLLGLVVVGGVATVIIVNESEQYGSVEVKWATN